MQAAVAALTPAQLEEYRRSLGPVGTPELEAIWNGSGYADRLRNPLARPDNNVVDLCIAAEESMMVLKNEIARKLKTRTHPDVREDNRNVIVAEVNEMDKLLQVVSVLHERYTNREDNIPGLWPVHWFLDSKARFDAATTRHEKLAVIGAEQLLAGTYSLRIFAVLARPRNQNSSLSESHHLLFQLAMYHRLLSIFSEVMRAMEAGGLRATLERVCRAL